MASDDFKSRFNDSFFWRDPNPASSGGVQIDNCGLESTETYLPIAIASLQSGTCFHPGNRRDGFGRIACVSQIASQDVRGWFLKKEFHEGATVEKLNRQSRLDARE